MVITEESVRRREQRQCEEYNLVAQEVSMAISEESARRIDQRQREGPRSNIITLPNWGKQQYDRDDEGVDRTITISNGPNFLKSGPINTILAHDKEEALDKDKVKPDGDLQTQLTIQGNHQKPPSRSEEDDLNSKRRVGSWKKKARVLNGVPMQIEDVVGTKRTVEVAIAAIDPKDSNGESKKKPRYGNFMVLHHPFTQSVEADTQPHREQ
ncbi:hypothetical protein U1Q18_010831 [Sarracenia purpurea var. burkii]